MDISKILLLGSMGLHPLRAEGENFWFYVVYIGFLLFIGIQFYTGQAMSYAWAVSRREKPVSYWSTMSIYTAIAFWITYTLFTHV